jgi:hypothetical protein
MRDGGAPTSSAATPVANKITRRFIQYFLLAGCSGWVQQCKEGLFASDFCAWCGICVEVAKHELNGGQNMLLPLR